MTDQPTTATNTITRDQLALAPLASRARAQLARLLVDPTGVVATDGTMLGRIDHDPAALTRALGEEKAPILTCTIPIATTQLMLQLARSARHQGPYRLALVGEATVSAQLLMAYNTIAEFRFPLETDFPDWRAVVPEAPTSIPGIRVAVELHSKMAALFAAVRAKSVRLTFYGDVHPVRYEGRLLSGAAVWGLVMPIRAEEDRP